MREIAKIIRYSGKLWRLYVAVAVLVVIIAILQLAVPFLIKLIVDAIVANLDRPTFNFSYIGLLIGLIFVAEVSITLIDNLNGYFGDQMAARLHSLLSQRYYNHLLKLPIEYYDNEVTGRITSRLERSIATISNLMQALANNFSQFFLTAFVTIVAMAFYSWPTALTLALLFPVYIWLTHLSSRAWGKKQEGINQDIDYAHGRFIEAITQIRVVKSFVQEAVEAKVFAARRRSVEAQTRVQSVEWHKYDVARRLIMNCIFTFIYGFIIWQTYSRRFSLGEMTLLIQLTNQARWPLFGSSFIIDQLQRATAGSKDYFSVMDIKPWITDRGSAKDLTVTDGAVEYNGVSFAYKGAKKVLDDVSFTIKPGQKLALVGESGEGKTTIANLLLRFYQPQSGRILVDGQDIAEITQASLRQNIAVVFQEPALFSGTVTENITYGAAKSDRAGMIEAAKAANAHDFIQKLPQGYDSEIGERGVKLSGGQKQRIAIARAIMKNAPILILDEATSSLDSKAERDVQEALERLMAERTTMIIAHRLSTIQNVDLIVGIRGGRVAEIGSPEELAEREDGIYAELLQLQTPTKANKARLKKYDIARV